MFRERCCAGAWRVKRRSHLCAAMVRRWQVEPPVSDAALMLCDPTALPVAQRVPVCAWCSPESLATAIAWQRTRSIQSV